MLGVVFDGVAPVLPFEAALADWVWLAAVLCWLCELFEAFCAWLAEFCPWLLEALLRVDAFCPEFRVELPLSAVLELLLELEDGVEELSEAPSAPNVECDDVDDCECETDFAGGGEATGVERIESRAT